MSGKAQFYDQYHSTPKIQTKVIAENNFTYRNMMGLIGPLLERKRFAILDYGCGVGTLDFYLSSRGHDVLGLEVSKRAIMVCRQSAAAQGLTHKLRFGEVGKEKIREKFDMVIASEVIEHIRDDRKLLRELSGFLKKGGILVISTPLTSAPLFRLNLISGFDKKVGHLRRYDRNTLVSTIEGMGLKIIRVKDTEGIVRNSLFVFPWLNWIVRFLKGPVSDLVSYIDEASLKMFGASNVHILAQKL